MSQKLSFRDGEVELTYDEGSRCAANPELKHKSVIHFICRCDGSEKHRGRGLNPLCSMEL